MTLTTAVATDPRVSVTTITPTLARELLERAGENRKLRKRTVAQYAGAMKRGEWVLNGEAVVLDTHGRLIQGQHRLAACIQADTSFDTVLVEGIEMKAQTTFDQGARRSMGDVLTMRGERYANRLAAAVRALWYYKESRNFRGPAANPTAAEMLDVLEESRPGIDEAVKAVQGVDRMKCAPGIAAACCYLFDQVEAEAGQAFFTQFKNGEGLTDGDPILALRNIFIATVRNSGRQVKPNVQGAWLIKAFNAWMQGNTIKQLSWRGGGAGAEQFPRIVTREELGIK